MNKRILKNFALIFLVVINISASAGGLINTASQPPAVESAFVAQTPDIKEDHIDLDIKVAPDTYLYQSSIKLSSPDIELGTIAFPPGEIIQDPSFGKTTVFKSDTHLSIPIRSSRNTSQEIELTLVYQGCHAQGFCYPPQTRTWELTLIGTNSPSVWEIVRFFGLGLLLSLTPCVLPMLPILGSLIVGPQQQHRRFRAFCLGLSYVLGMAMAYATLGAIVGGLGQHVQVYLQTPWVLGMAAFLLLLFAIILINERLEHAFLSRFSLSRPKNHRAPRGGYVGAVLMGMGATFVISPCVTPPMVAALTWIAVNGNVWTGSLALALMGLGMGVPILLLTFLGTAALPAKGPWMHAIKPILGFILVGMAIQLLARFLPYEMLTILYGLGLLAWSIWLFVHPIQGAHRLLKFLRLIVLCISLLASSFYLFARFIPEDLSKLLPTSASVQSLLPFETITTLPELQERLTKAAQAKQPVLVDVYAQWCVSCVAFEKQILPQPAVQKALKDFVRIRFDVTNYQANSAQFLQSLRIWGPPALLFYDKMGEMRADLQHNGPITEAVFLDKLRSFE